MANRGEEKKQNALNKILRRNLPDEDVKVQEMDDEFGTKPAPSQNPLQATPKNKRDLLKESKTLSNP